MCTSWQYGMRDNKVSRDKAIFSSPLYSMNTLECALKLDKSTL